jgi:hypothetical protein
MAGLVTEVGFTRLARLIGQNSGKPEFWCHLDQGGTGVFT